MIQTKLSYLKSILQSRSSLLPSYCSFSKDPPGRDQKKGIKKREKNKDKTEIKKEKYKMKKERKEKRKV